jgi:hypothetical protein
MGGEGLGFGRFSEVFSFTEYSSVGGGVAFEMGKYFVRA